MSAAERVPGIQGFLASTALRKRSNTPRLQGIEVQVDNARRRAASGEWDDACGATMVGLYAFCHELIYGIVPEELRSDPTMKVASKVAARFVRTHFDGDWAGAARFVKWCWEREKGRHTWALANGVSRQRLSWRLQFNASLLTDWRVANFKPQHRTRKA